MLCSNDRVCWEKMPRRNLSMKWTVRPPAINWESSWIGPRTLWLTSSTHDGSSPNLSCDSLSNTGLWLIPSCGHLLICIIHLLKFLWAIHVSLLCKLDRLGDIDYELLTHSWPLTLRWHFNMAIIFISFLFFILMMVTWREPLDSSGNSDYTQSVPA